MDNFWLLSMAYEGKKNEQTSMTEKIPDILDNLHSFTSTCSQSRIHKVK